MPQADQRESSYEKEVVKYGKKRSKDYEDARSRAINRLNMQEERFKRSRDLEPGELALHRKKADAGFMQASNMAYQYKNQDIDEAYSGKKRPDEVMSSLYGKRESDIELPKEKKRPGFGRKKR